MKQPLRVPPKAQEMQARQSAQRAKTSGLYGGIMNCSDTAYVSVLTVSRWGNTFISRQGSVGAGAAANNATTSLRLQWSLLLTLAQSLRRHETCFRDFILLLGPHVLIPPTVDAAMATLGMVVVRITSLDPAIPPLDHLHAWRLTTYRQVVVLDCGGPHGALEETPWKVEFCSKF